MEWVIVFDQTDEEPRIKEHHGGWRDPSTGHGQRFARFGRAGAGSVASRVQFGSASATANARALTDPSGRVAAFSARRNSAAVG